MSAKRRIIPLFIPHYGCTHDCVFCDQRQITGTYSPAAADDVRTAFNSLLQERRREMNKEKCPADSDDTGDMPAELAFYGGSFTALPEDIQIKLLEAAQPFVESSPHNSIRISTRPDHIDEPIIAMLKRYGVKTIELGAQSMCDDVLLLSRRGHTATDVERSARLIKDAGLSLILQMMTGLPGDSEEKSLYTAKRLIDIAPDGVRIYPTVVLRGTRLYDMWRSGKYREQGLNEAAGLCVQLCSMFTSAGITVIRLGLNPNESLSSGDAVAGPYHPAFGQLVYSKMYHDKAFAMLEDVEPDSAVTLIVARGQTSTMIGHNSQNIKELTKSYSLRTLKVVETDIARGEIKIEIAPEKVYNT